jgi:hypothetical protein
MAQDTGENRETESASQSGTIGERLEALRQKTSQLDETLTEIEEHLDEAREEKA